jgi:YRPW motif-containing protein
MCVIDNLPSSLSLSPSPSGFSDPYAAYGNTRAFLDYRIMGIRECVAESARYLSSVEGVDMKDPMRIRMLNHLENFLSQRELAVNAAVAANAHNTQLVMPKVAQQATAVTAGTPVPIPTVVTVPALSAVTAPGHPYAPLTPPRASPDNLSPPANMTAASEPLPRFSVAFPAGPIISFAPTATVPVPVFRTGPSSFKPVAPPTQSSVKTVAPLPTAITSTTAAAKPLNVIMTANKTTIDKTNLSNPSSPHKTTKAPFRPWADTMTVADSS